MKLPSQCMKGEAADTELKTDLLGSSSGGQAHKVSCR